ncbi:MAG TPA: hypothetical protein VJU79_10935, partial [Candidatus Dormibacteraeota bacterium]|nr:hypothetical protein [Candidatus Dormibacteraeota bacterium]
LWVLRDTPADYFQPGIVISGGLTALGIAPWLTLLLWKPVAVVAFFFVSREYVGRSVTGVWARRAALVLALFFGSFTIVYGSFSVLGDLVPGFLSWGYVFGLIALASMVAALLSYDRARAAGRLAWTPGLLGALAGLLHPWNGELLILVVIGAELLLGWRALIGRGIRRGLALPALTLLLSGLPLLYYLILGRTDLSWRLAREASKHSFPLWSIALAILPLLIPAMLAAFKRSRSFLPAATRAWLLCAFALFVVSGTSVSATPLHAFQGITLPLAVLAVEGLQAFDFGRLRPRSAGTAEMRRPRQAAVLAIALVTIPANVYLLNFARTTAAPKTDNANFIARDEKAALKYLERDPDPGGVLARSYMGEVIPATTGRHTLVGDCLWSEPRCYTRVQAARDFFHGVLSPRQARRFVKQSGAKFVLADCAVHTDLTRVLAPLTVSVRQFGCARVYEIGSPSHPEGPLAQSPRDALVRATRRQ